MKIVLYLVIALHGIIHVFGFLKAYDLFHFKGISQPVSKPLGILWLISCILFGSTLFLLMKDYRLWWVFGIIAIVLSQVLIFLFWQDTKFGSIPNVLILVPCIVGFFQATFSNKIVEERQAMLSSVTIHQSSSQQKSINTLPIPVQKWLRKSGIDEKAQIKKVYLTQDIKMKLKPEQKNWNTGQAEQYFTIYPPGFNWSVDLNMNALLSIQGRDRFENGIGEMLMKIVSIFSVVDVKDNEKINQAALQRYLAEIIWFPSAALSPHIKWETLDDHTAKATFHYKNIKGSGVFHFNEQGDFKRFTAKRYKDTDDTAKKHEWIAEATEWNTINGVRVPTKLSVTWKLAQKDWTWLELEITELKYTIVSSQ